MAPQQQSNHHHHGVGAIVSALIRFIHPSSHISERFGNHPTTTTTTTTTTSSNQRLNGCVTVRQELKKVSGRDQLTLVVHHEDFKTADGEYMELYAVKRYWRIELAGDPNLRFDASNNGSSNGGGGGGGLPAQEDSAKKEEEEDEESFRWPQAVAEHILLGSHVTPLQETMEALRDVVEMDDDNEPLPENIPDNNNNTTTVVGVQEGSGTIVLETEWGHDGVCPRRSANIVNHRARLEFAVDPMASDFYLQLFEGLFPSAVLQIVINRVNQKIDDDPLTLGELLRWIGLWVLLSTVVEGADRRAFWASQDTDIFEGAPFRLTAFMSLRRFEAILDNMGYTEDEEDDPPPATTTNRDRFWPVRSMLDLWNKNMAEKFIPSWINCIDKSMSKWVNEYTCPGFLFVPRKAWPFGNQYHDACCASSEIVWQIDLREGKDRPPELGPREYDNLGTTIGVLLRLTEPIWGTGKVVVLDSGYCVLQGLVELKKRGVFASSPIQKRRYWPKHVPGDQIVAHFASKPVGAVDALQGKLDGVSFHIHCIKEKEQPNDENDVTMFLSTYGTLQEMGEFKKRHYTTVDDGVQQVKTFQYPEVVHNHYQYRNCMDHHNSSRMHPISMEETWMTTRWPDRVFCFLLAVTMVNVQNAAAYFFQKEEKLDALSARKLIAKALIHNKYLQTNTTTTAPPPQQQQQQQRRSSSSPSPSGHNNNKSIVHTLVPVPQYKKFFRGRLKSCRTKYGKWKCNDCDKFVRKYCTCNPGLILCIDCFGNHRVRVATAGAAASAASSSSRPKNAS